MNVRRIEEILKGRPASDGDGVKLTRIFGGADPERFDPFLLMDEFGSDESNDYIGGFPSHPHRGFETVTYMLEGHMEHRDHMGNVGELRNGDVQWMTAAAGVIHSEMPKQEEGRLRGFQVWLNLPANEKMKSPAYRDIPAADIPVYERGAIRIKSIAGQLIWPRPQSQDKDTDNHPGNGETLRGAVSGLTTDPAFLDIDFSASAAGAGQNGAEPLKLAIEVPDQHRALLYLYEGEAVVGEDRRRLGRGELALLSASGRVELEAAPGSRAVLLTGRPLREPIVQYGPFVMNSRSEIEQALEDYRDGRFARQ